MLFYASSNARVGSTSLCTFWTARSVPPCRGSRRLHHCGAPGRGYYTSGAPSVARVPARRSTCAGHASTRCCRRGAARAAQTPNAERHSRQSQRVCCVGEGDACGIATEGEDGDDRSPCTSPIGRSGDRSLIEAIAAGHRAKDGAAIARHYVPDARIADLAPPLLRRGVDPSGRQAWLADELGRWKYRCVTWWWRWTAISRLPTASSGSPRELWRRGGGLVVPHHPSARPHPSGLGS
jgi:hypothetical protein